MDYKKLVFHIVLIFLTWTSIFIFGEVFVQIFSPVESLYPRYEFSPRYGLQLFKNIQMVDSTPGKYKFVYTTNEYGYRGKAIPPLQRDDKKIVLVLGDSNSFGIGVNDGEEYPARLGKEIGEDYIVVNLANPAWGLTQEIRRYYDFGIFYHPTIVILQFCGNDPEDNFNNMVTTVEGDSFVFHNSNSDINWIKKYLSRSIIQKSQLYNFFRGRLYLLYHNWHINRTKTNYAVEKKVQSSIPPGEKFYRDLLAVFASDLKKSGVKLLMISVNHHLDGFLYIKEKVQELHTEGTLYYVDISPWFEDVSNYQSEEGHEWGKRAHDIIGKNLAAHIKKISERTNDL